MLTKIVVVDNIMDIYDLKVKLGNFLKPSHLSTRQILLPEISRCRSMVSTPASISISWTGNARTTTVGDDVHRRFARTVSQGLSMMIVAFRRHPFNVLEGALNTRRHSHPVDVIGQVPSSPQEPPQEVAVRRDLPLHQGINLIWIHSNAFIVDNATQDFDLASKKLKFLLAKCIRIDDNIIKVYAHPVPNVGRKQMVYQCLASASKALRPGESSSSDSHTLVGASPRGSGVPILSHMSSLRFPASFPHDFMHLFDENTLKNLVFHWTGTFKELDEGREHYEIPKTVWDAVGSEATAQSGNTIPSAYGSRVPHIATDRASMSAEMWSFWALYIGPVLLRWQFQRPKYFEHFVLLMRLMHICLQFEVDDEQLYVLRKGFIKWVTEYEDRPCLVLLGVPHGALPREVTASNSESTLSICRDRRICPGRGTALTDQSTPRIPHICAAFRTRLEVESRGPPDSHTRPGARKGSATSTLSIARVKEYMKHAQIHEWGKVRRVDSDEGDTMRAALLRATSEDSRDATFVRYQMYVDRNAAYRRMKPVFELLTFYGQLQHIFVVRLDAPEARQAPQLPRGQDTVIFAAIRTCVLDDDMQLRDLDLDIHFYSKMGALHVVDITSIATLATPSYTPFSYAGRLHCGEFTTKKGDFDPSVKISKRCVQFFPDYDNATYIVLHLPASNTDPFCKDIAFHIAAAPGKPTCPVAALKRMYAADADKDLDGPRSYERAASIREARFNASYNPNLFAGHSFRRGAASAAAAAGCSDYEIQLLGRWRSDPYKLYIEFDSHRLYHISSSLHWVHPPSGTYESPALHASTYLA
ncbi:hypothetical protein LshimejAT787_1502090 [Lyophyllum shimeji]|uniref:Uncharacterized protein n=1 Tax=Lyophyllum shimeji TaxID=47721 RepID=A0A9P3PW26_LYOSH|nr:hypothetical protein LshimejAT787_1502090 [Lyophyllum shimeji]